MIKLITSRVFPNDLDVGQTNFVWLIFDLKSTMMGNAAHIHNLLIDVEVKGRAM